jgi:thymidylate synthase (FAD)
MEVKILDHGYIKLIERWGSDERIIEAARMSTDKGFLGWGPFDCGTCDGQGKAWINLPHGWLGDGKADATTRLLPCNKCDGTGKVPGDEKLLAYLWKNQHTTPFEMAGAIIEVQAPIMVFREWQRHRVQSYNELSARYTPLPDFNYIPTVERCMRNSKTNKQAGTITGAQELTQESAITWLQALNSMYFQIEALYQEALKRGVPKELARLPIPVGRYSRMRASAVLLNWLKFLTLRSDKNMHAQEEIRVYSNALHDILQPLFPRTLALFDEGR